MRPGPDDDGEANPQANFGLTLGRYGAGALADDYGDDGGFARVAYGLLTGNGPTGIATWLAAAPNTATIGQSAANANMRGLFVYIRMHFLLKGYSAVMRPRMVELYTAYYERKIRERLEEQGRLGDFTAQQITNAARASATERVEGMWSWMPKNHWLNMPKASFDALLTAIGDGQQVVTRYTAWQGAVTLAASARQNAICNLPDGWANALDDAWERAHGADIVAACREAVTAAGANLRATNPLAPHPVAPFQIGGNVAMVIESRVPPLAVRGAFRYSRRAPIIHDYYDWTRDGSVSGAVRLVCTMNGLNRDTCQ